jgi:hypothetical protein
VLEFVEEALDEIALTVEGKITSPRRLAVGFRRNHGGDFALGERIEERVGVVRLVANQSLWISLLKRRLCASQIVGLPRREHQIDRIAEGIDKDMNFSGQSAARSADRLLAVFFRAPALASEAITDRVQSSSVVNAGVVLVGFSSVTDISPARIATDWPTPRNNATAMAVNALPPANYASNSAASQTSTNQCQLKAKWKHKKHYQRLGNQVLALEAEAKTQRFKKPLSTQLFAYHIG